jgi:Ca-activated chloride channel homolog
MSLAHPLALLAMLLALAVAGALSAWWRHRVSQQQRQVGIGVPHLHRHSAFRDHLRQICLWSGLALGCIAIASPRWGAVEEERQVEGIDLLIAIDCSRSMLADDLFPDRSRAARDKAVDLVKELGDARISLLPFAGVPTLRCPLTSDQIAIARMLDDCTPELFPASVGLQGTAIGQAVRTGVGILGRDAGRGQAILVISDGSDPDHEAVTKAARYAKEANIPVYGLFVGDQSRPATIRVDGRDVAVPADRSSLDELASATGGICANHTAGLDDVSSLADHLLANLHHAPWEETRQRVQSERYRWPLVPAIVFLTLGFILPTVARRRVA